MEVILKIDELLERQKEVFDQYIINQREVNMLPLLEKYGKKDNQVYSIEEAYKYLKMYTTSEIISEDELEQFSSAKKVDPTLIFKRGKKAVKELIESNDDDKELYILASEFAKTDGRIKSYPINYVRKCIEYYKNNTKNTTLIKTLDTIRELTNNKANREFDLSLINTLVSFDNVIMSINFIKSINISFDSLKRLIDTYCVLYPANEKEISYLEEITYQLKQKNQNNLIPNTGDNKSKRLNKLSHLLEIYLITDIDDIYKIEGKYHMSEYEFNLALKEGILSNDPIILSLIDKYNIKERTIEEANNNIVLNIGNSILNGVNYGNGYQAFNIIDYFNMYDGLKFETIISKVRALFDKDKSEYILKVLNHLDFQSTYQTIEDLSRSIGVFSKNGRNITKEEKEGIIEYIATNDLPINNSVFFAACERYFNGDLEIDVVKKIA